jgi:hypothetical protein
MNEDIVRHIYSFGYPEHRLYMKQLCKEINSVLSGNIYPVGWPENRIGGEALCTFLQREKTYEELIDLYETYKNCKCCTRHCCYKPKLATMDYNCKLNPNPYYTRKYYKCNCQCRALMRHVYFVLS